jgi:hypothetical protein
MTEANIDINQIYIILKIISNIKEYDKLIKTADNMIEIDNGNYTQAFRRWWNGHNRNETIEFLKDFIYNQTFKIIDDTLDNELDNKKMVNFFKETNHNILQKFLLELKNSIKGLQNLKITYSKDITITSNLDQIIEEIQFRIERIKQSLQISIALPIPLRNGKLRGENN